MAASGFTPASQRDVFSIQTEKRSCKRSRALSGEEARHFYEDLMKDGRVGQTRQTRRSRRSSRSSRSSRRRSGGAVEVNQGQTDSVAQRGAPGVSDGDQRGERSSSETMEATELRGLRMLRCAHEGDVSGLKDLLAKGVDVNFQDTFFWTAVMCASWSGQKAAVRLLLRHGAAWVGVVDTRGRDAQDLALEAGHNEVLEELLSYGGSTRRETQSDRSALQPQWCDVCGSEYSSNPSSHLSSTLHQFSLRRPPPAPYYCLPSSSNSYKMMVRCGWKPGSGLGPEGDGPMQPVPTVLKRDQEGLGYGRLKRAKVTHFQARDHAAVKPPSKDKEERGRKGQRKEGSKRKEQREKNWERDFRTSFYL
ncbi:G patch domain and ankyrin repeat-containing protein 1 [Embiotoca jacksoni]|uniref:G patch domain and ankyrin repeat-containing protein 1 n=1 Tax=Embiotoca jacksoni TaxID=100190 RepID=UPI0037046527